MAHAEYLVRFPVSCPTCRQEVLVEFPRAAVIGALVNDRPIRLHAPCCEASWTAAYIEMQQIRAHVGAARLDTASRNLPAKTREALDD